jgi:hypothetical protein
MNTNFSDINIPKLIEKAEILTQTYEGKVETIIFYVELEPTFLDVFEEFSFLIGINDGNYVLDNSNNIKVLRAKFSAESILLEEKQMANVVNLIMKMCGTNDEYWTNVDHMRILSGAWRGRTNTDYNVFISLDEDENFTLEFTSLNEFIAKTASA